jgi:hypothetical protein
MSVQAMSWVIDHSRQKGANLLCLLMIANHARSDGTGAWPSIAMLAGECRMSERQIKRIIPLLAESGELRVDPDKGPRGTHLYTIAGMPGRDKLSPQSPRGDKLSPTPLQEDKMSPRGGDISAALGDILSPLGDIAMSYKPSLKNHQLEPSERESRAQAHTRGTGEHQARAPTRLVTIEQMVPFNLPEAEWDELRSHGIADKWAVAHVDIFIANYENTGTERSAEEWYSKCRKWLLQDWDKAQTTGKRR